MFKNVCFVTFYTSFCLILCVYIFSLFSVRILWKDSGERERFLRFLLLAMPGGGVTAVFRRVRKNAEKIFALSLRIIFAHIIKIEVAVIVRVIHHHVRAVCLVEGMAVEVVDDSMRIASELREERRCEGV